MAGDYIVLKKGALPELSHNIEDYPDGIVILLDKPLFLQPNNTS